MVGFSDGKQHGSAVVWWPWLILARRGARWKAVGRNRIARSWQSSIGRVTADWKTGPDDAGDSK